MKKFALLLLAACGDADATQFDLPEPSSAQVVYEFPQIVEWEQCTTDVIEVPAPAPPEPGPIYFRVFETGSELCSVAALDFALDVAIARWRSTTCLPLQRSETEGHSFQWAAQEDMSEPGRLAQTNGTWEQSKVQLVAEHMCPDIEGSYDHAIRAIAHEMWHILARTNKHVENNSVADSGGDGDWSRFDAPISHGVISRVCRQQDCKCFYPED